MRTAACKTGLSNGTSVSFIQEYVSITLSNIHIFVFMPRVHKIKKKKKLLINVKIPGPKTVPQTLGAAEQNLVARTTWRH
jgi:hypothetical protein